MLTTKIRPLSNLRMKWGSFLPMGTKYMVIQRGERRVLRLQNFTRKPISQSVFLWECPELSIVEASSNSIDFVQF